MPLTGGLVSDGLYKGAWNASTNTPAIASSVGTAGDWYIVNTAGATSINGIASWAVGDQIRFNGSIWQKVAAISVLPLATASTPGAVQPDNTSTEVDGSGILSATAILRDEPAARAAADAAILSTLSTTYVTDQPNFEALLVDGNGYTTDYLINQSRQLIGVGVSSSAYVTDIPGMTANVIDVSGYSADYYSQGKRFSDGIATASAVDGISWLIHSEVGLLGVHGDGYGVLGPLPARDWGAFAVGAEGSRQIWLVSKDGVRRQISSPDDGADCFGPQIVGSRLTFIATDGVSPETTAALKSITLLGAAFTVDPSVTIIEHNPFSGQSNMNGNSTHAIIEDTPSSPGFALMFNRGIRVHGYGNLTPERLLELPPDDLRYLVDAIEHLIPNGPGETGCSNFAKIVAQATAETAVLVSNHAISSLGYEFLKKGTAPYSNMLKAVRAARIIATLNDLDYDVPTFGYNGNEGNILLGDSAAVFRGHMEELQEDFTNDVNIITGANKEVVLIYVQIGNNSYYNLGASVAQGQLDAATINPTKIICAGPGYIYPTVDGVHKSAQGQYDSRAIEAAYRNRLRVGQDTLPLYMESATRTGGTVVCTFHLPVGATSISFNTSFVSNPGNHGVSWHQTGGTAQTISSLLVTSANQVTIQLSGDPGSPSSQQIGIAWLYTSGGAAAGPTTGSRSTIATDTGEYACQQIIDVT